MRYNYKCKKPENSCKLSDLPKKFYDGELDIEIASNAPSIKTAEDGRICEDSPLVWVVSHGMNETPEIKCPICDCKATRVIGRFTFYFRGDCYLDKAGCQRDMNLYKLQKDDPYGYMRQPGEKDHLVDQIKKRGKHDPKPQYFRTSKKDPPKKCIT